MGRYRRYGTCYLCGKFCGLSRDHFIPKVFLDQLYADGIELYQDAITVGACQDCNKHKGHKILVPPLSYHGYMYEGFNSKLLYNFNRFVEWVLKHYDYPSSFYYDWSDHYGYFKCYGNYEGSYFNSTKHFDNLNTIPDK